MSWGTFVHNIARLKYSCSALTDTYGANWSTFLSDADTFEFPDNPTGMQINPSSFVGNVLNVQTLPTGKLFPIDVCSPDTLTRYIRQYDDLGATSTNILRTGNRVGNDTYRAIIGPAGQTRSGISALSAIRTTFRFEFWVEFPGTTWLPCYVNVSLTTVDTNSDGTYDTLRVTVSYTNVGSYWVEEPDATNWDNSITASEYAALWAIAPFSGPQPFDQGSSPSKSVDFDMDTLFPDADYLWTPLSIKAEASSPFVQALTGRRFFADRDSYWFHPKVTVGLGNTEVEIEMPGDMMIRNDGTVFSTDPWPITSPTGSGQNIGFWAARHDQINGIAIGGVGNENTGTWTEFKETVLLNRNL